MMEVKGERSIPMKTAAGTIVRKAMLVLGIGAAVGVLVAPVAGQNFMPPETPVPAKPPLPMSKTWKPARLPDGQPDVQGSLWGPVVTGTHNPLENPTGGKTQVPSRISDPPDGRIPYQ